MGGSGIRHGRGLISRRTNWEEKGPHMLRLTSQPAREKARVGKGVYNVCVCESERRIPKVKEP